MGEGLQPSASSDPLAARKSPVYTAAALQWEMTVWVGAGCGTAAPLGFLCLECPYRLFVPGHWSLWILTPILFTYAQVESFPKCTLPSWPFLMKVKLAPNQAVIVTL